MDSTELLERYVQAHDALVQYKKEVREATKERNAELGELADALRAEMLEKGLDEVEYNDRVIQLATRLQISK